VCLADGWGAVPPSKGEKRRNPNAPDRVAFTATVRAAKIHDPGLARPEYVMHPYRVSIAFLGTAWGALDVEVSDPEIAPHTIWSIFNCSGTPSSIYRLSAGYACAHSSGGIGRLGRHCRCAKWMVGRSPTPTHEPRPRSTDKLPCSQKSMLHENGSARLSAS
jgi:hypothetical protein